MVAKKQIMRIWTEAYRPFIMGGDCNAPIVCAVPVDGPFDLGAGQQGFLAVSPSGRTFVAEGVTGAIVGSTIEGVRRDVEMADRTVMEEQIASAEKRVLQATPVSRDEFWRLLRAAR